MDLEKIVSSNKSFRNIVFEGKDLQGIVMHLAPGKTIPKETHEDADQWFYVVSGKIKIFKYTPKKTQTTLNAGSYFVVEKGVEHCVQNCSSTTEADILTIYSKHVH